MNFQKRHIWNFGWKALLLIPLLALFLASCESVIFIELEDSEKLIVLNGLLAEDSTLQVQVSRTRHILDNANLETLDNASVSLLRDGVELGDMQKDEDGNYVFPAHLPEPGREYSIRASQTGFPDVEARVSLPQAVPITGLDTATSVYEYDYDYYVYSEEVFYMDLGLTDPSPEENYYLVNGRIDRALTSWRDTSYSYWDSAYVGGEWRYFMADTFYTIIDTFRVNESFIPYSDDLIAEANTDEGVVFSDQLIDGRDYSIHLFAHTYMLSSADSANVELCLHSISESYYKYLVSRERHFETREDPFAVPVIVYSNVEGGTGVLGGSSADVREFTTWFEGDQGYYYYEPYY